MNKLNKILWAVFSSVICMIYKDAIGMTCSYMITSSKWLSARVGTTTVEGKEVAQIVQATCSAANICDGWGTGTDCGGVWRRYEDITNGAASPEMTVSRRPLCDGKTGYYITKEECNVLTGCGHECASCPDGGTAPINYHAQVNGIDYTEQPIYICGQQNPITGADLTGVYMLEVGYVCDGPEASVKNDISDCYLKSGSYRNVAGSYDFIDSCNWTVSSEA